MPEDKDTLFGRLAVEREYVAQEQLDEAREAQERGAEAMGVRMPIAQILVSKGLLTKDQAQDLANAVAVQTGEASIVAGYQMIAKLGEGGMGAVYKARHVETGQYVALKILPPSLATEGLIKRFKREAEITARLDHEHIVGCVEFGQDPRRKCWFCALELIEGEDLGKLIKRKGRLDETEAVSITKQIASALEHAFTNGLVHRDVKPENIMVTPEGTAKLLDLGLARPARVEATRFTQSGMFVGSPYYASPEQAVGDRDIDIRSDVYSLGATLYHMVTGRPPFVGGAIPLILQKHLTEQIEWPAEVNPDLSNAVCEVIAKMMAKDQADRYQTLAELMDHLDRLAGGEELEIEEKALKSSSVKAPALPRAVRVGAGRGRRRRGKRGERAREDRRGASREAPEKASGWSALPTGAKVAIPVVAGLLAAAGLAIFLSGPKPDRPRPKPRTPKRRPQSTVKTPPPRARATEEPRPRRKPPATPVRKQGPGKKPPILPRPADVGWRTVCDGTSLDFIAEWSRKYWRVRDGAVVLDLSRAGGKEGLLSIPGTFRDVEVAMRFSLTRPPVVPHIGLGVRFIDEEDTEPEKQYKGVVWGGSLTAGEHELRVTARGDIVTATIDGKATEVRDEHSPREGRIQLVVIQTAESGFKIHSIRMREPAAVGPVGFTRGLVGHWTFDEGEGTTARDSSGKGNHGKIVGGAKCAKGKVGGALEFDGIDDFVDLPDGFADLTKGLTFAVWAKPVKTNGLWPRFIELADAGGRYNIVLARRDMSDDLRLEVYHGTLVRGRSHPNVTATGAIEQSTWQHFAATIDRTGLAALYKNGVEVARYHVGLPVKTNRTVNRVGRSCFDRDARYKGLMDDVRIYNRALLPEEIRLLAHPEDWPQVKAKKQKEELAALLSNFDSLIGKGDHAGARRYAESEAAKRANAHHAKTLKAAARVARELEARAKAIRQAVEGQLGKEVELRTTKGKLAGKVEDVTDEAIVLAIKEKTRGGGAVEMRMNVKWADLVAEQEDALAGRGGWKPAGADGHLARAVIALSRKDAAGARKALAAAGEHPLAAHYRAKVAARKPVVRTGRSAEPAPTLTLDLGRGVKMQFVYVKPGVFMMGGTENPKHSWQGVEKPKHEVAITRGFYIGKYEVTQAQYEAVMGANPSKWKEPNRPVEQVTWHKAAEFCRLATERTRRRFRLPTEAEWEFACRAGSTGRYCFGSDETGLGDYAWCRSNSGGQTHPVGRKKPNAWGLYDVHGNVWEWVADWYAADYYANSPRENPAGPDAGNRRPCRGGSSLDRNAWRSAFRALLPPSQRKHNHGFRAVVPSSASTTARFRRLR